MVALEAPVRFTVAPAPPGPLMLPEMLDVCSAEEKLAVPFAPLSVTA